MIVYESLYGNTKQIAEAVAVGIRRVDPTAVIDLLPVTRAEGTVPDGVDLLVVGGPTHMWSLSRPSSRQSAKAAAARADSQLSVEPDAPQEFGIREWLDQVVATAIRTAAFDTRRSGPSWLTGHASSGIARRLHKRNGTAPISRESFLVDKKERLVSGEIHRAQAWGWSLARDVWDIIGARAS
jgi:hypothetical protein